MARAIVIQAHGGPEALQAQEVDVGAPGPGELRLRQTYAGVNFHDVYVRSGEYRTLKLPGVPGIEGVGVVDQVGPGVEGFRAGAASATSRVRTAATPANGCCLRAWR
jgi:NADPH:quinone reductase